VLRSILIERCGSRLWKVVKRNNLSGSYIFNRCSVQIPLERTGMNVSQVTDEVLYAGLIEMQEL